MLAALDTAIAIAILKGKSHKAQVVTFDHGWIDQSCMVVVLSGSPAVFRKVSGALVHARGRRAAGVTRAAPAA